MTIPFTTIEGVYVGNQWVATREREEVINPATEEVIGHAPVADLAITEQAIAAAREAFDKGPWPQMSFRERAAVMRKMHAVLERRLPEIQALTIAEAGATHAVTNLTQTATPLRHLLYLFERDECVKHPGAHPVRVDVEGQVGSHVRRITPGVSGDRGG